jgi:hypothetical protein
MIKLSTLVNKFHLMLSGYITIGWMFSDIHSKVLLGLIPSVYANWLIWDHMCVLTVLENKLICIETAINDNSKNDKAKNDNSKNDNSKNDNEGFFLKKLRSYNINISSDDLNKILTLISYHSLYQSYSNVIKFD